MNLHHLSQVFFGPRPSARPGVGSAALSSLSSSEAEPFLSDKVGLRRSLASRLDRRKLMILYLVSSFGGQAAKHPAMPPSEAEPLLSDKAGLRRSLARAKAIEKRQELDDIRDRDHETIS